ncbi:phosphodiesterase [Cryobacterium algoritolerans]|uniref:Phosphodiesterase n=1 Tax=Cryobacterium algoritolerans TaxID=1259184 RepID=A0A4R8WLT8_9MICO|nr:phosphodiesterase [Cryobacterium algoritolerans]
MRPGDVLARLGGDEFAVLPANVHEAQALAIANRVVLSASVPFVCDGQLLRVSASVGIVMAGEVAVARGLSGLDVLLRQADGAMIRAKQAGKRQVSRRNGHGGAAPIARNARIHRRLTDAFETRVLALQLAARTIVPDVRTALGEHGIPAGPLQVEITEGAAISDLRRAIGQLREQREMGISISIALDDYGTGYSSLSMLRDLPLNIVKIGKIFIDGIDASPAAADLALNSGRRANETS